MWQIYSTHFLQKVWLLQFVNQIKWINTTVVSCDVTGEITGLNWKYIFLPFTYPTTYQVEFWYFKSLCNWHTVSNRTYQNFCDKRLVRPGSKCPNWQRSQPISYKAKFLQRHNIFLEDLKCNITYQNIRGETKVRPIFIPSNS